ncbi:MAG TPA: hypothetical protein VLB49_03815 [Gemmatimonadales bacterium]|nr:hypothetical protein [Gemmatimonadales bacterium]
MRWPWALLLSGLGMALAAPTTAQRQALPYGLRAGRHAVAVRVGGGWHPVALDSGPAQVLLLSDAQPVGPDSATAVYLATHGYIVVYGASGSPRPSARIELHPAGALARITVAGQRVTVAMPPGSGDHTRLRAAVTLAALDLALRVSPPALPGLVRRLRAAGLVVHTASEEG